MNKHLNDTSPKCEEVQIEILRQLSKLKKFEMVCLLSQMTLNLSKRAIIRNNANLSENQINLLFIKYQYGEKLASRVEKYIEGKIIWNQLEL